MKNGESVLWGSAVTVHSARFRQLVTGVVRETRVKKMTRGCRCVDKANSHG